MIVFYKLVIINLFVISILACGGVGKTTDTDSLGQLNVLMYIDSPESLMGSSAFAQPYINFGDIRIPEDDSNAPIMSSVGEDNTIQVAFSHIYERATAPVFVEVDSDKSFYLTHYDTGSENISAVTTFIKFFERYARYRLEVYMHNDSPSYARNYTFVNESWLAGVPEQRIVDIFKVDSVNVYRGMEGLLNKQFEEQRGLLNEVIYYLMKEASVKFSQLIDNNYTFYSLPVVPADEEERQFILSTFNDRINEASYQAYLHTRRAKLLKNYYYSSYNYQFGSRVAADRISGKPTKADAIQMVGEANALYVFDSLEAIKQSLDENIKSTQTIAEDIYSATTDEKWEEYLLHISRAREYIDGQLVDCFDGEDFAIKAESIEEPIALCIMPNLGEGGLPLYSGWDYVSIAITVDRNESSSEGAGWPDSVNMILDDDLLISSSTKVNCQKTRWLDLRCIIYRHGGSVMRYLQVGDIDYATKILRAMVFHSNFEDKIFSNVVLYPFLGMLSTDGVAMVKYPYHIPIE